MPVLEPLEERQMLAVFSNSTPIAIPGTGTSGPADPYPSSINVPAPPSFIQASIVDVNVTLHDLTHTHPDDIDVLLVAPGGQNATIMSDVGGSDDVTNVTLDLDDEAVDPLPDGSPLVSGTFQPANYGGGDTFDPPAPAPSGNVALSTFDGLTPGGTWQLFIQDDLGGDEGDLNGGWSLEIVLGANVVIDGTNLDDTFIVDLNGDNVRVRRNGITVFEEPQAGVSSLTLNGLIGNDLLTVDSTNGLVDLENGIRFDGGTGFDRIDVTQSGGAPDGVVETLAIGPLPGKGRHTIAAGDAEQRIDFENIEPFNTNVLAATFNITSVPGIATLLDADNAINYVAGTLNGPTWGRVTVDNFEPIEFINKTNLVIDAGAGSDEISLNNPNTPTGLTGITVNGQDPTGSDTLIINGVAATTLVTLDTSTITGASGAAGVVPIVYSGIEHIKAVAGASTTLAVDNTNTVDGIDYTVIPGVAIDEGVIQPNTPDTTIPIAFKGYGPGKTLSLRGDTDDGDDTLTILGTASNDSISVAATTGNTTIAGRATISKDADMERLVIDGLDGDDTFTVAGNHPWSSIEIAGGDPSASDVLNFVGGGAAITVDLTAETVTETGFGPVSFVGVEHVNIDANNSNLTVVGTADDDVISYTPLTASSGKFAWEGHNIQFAFTDVPVANTFTVDGGAGAVADELLLYGTNNHDVITVNSTNRTATVENAAGTVLRNVTLANSMEVVRAFGLLGNDTFLVVPAPAVPPGVPVGSPGFAIPRNLLVYVDGGPPGASDALVVAGLSAVAPVTVPLAPDLFTVVNRSRNPNEGVVRIFQDQAGIGNEPFQFPDIVYSDVEVVSPIPFVNALGNPQLLILGPDQYEPNEFRTNAAFIGAGSAQNVIDLSIFPNAFEHRFVQADQDYFRVVAQYTGVMDFQVYFKNVPEFLPGNGDLDIQVRDEDGNIITGFGVNDFPLSPGGDERRRIPVVAGETYYLQVFGKLDTTVNAYSMSVINTPAPVPRDLELDDVIDVGDVTAAVSATNFTGSAGLSTTDDFYNGKYVSFLSGPNNGRRAEIVDYVGATRQFLLASGLLVAPNFGDDFQIESIDTGRTQFDNTTRDATPTIFIRLDDDFLLNDLHGGGTGQLPPDNQVIPIPFRNAAAAATDPGYRVAIFDEVDTQNPVFQGFADQVPGQPGVYTFTFTNPLPDGSHFLTAKVQMVDPSVDADRDFGAASVSLEIVVDTLTPPVFFGDPVVIDDGLDATSDSGVAGQPDTFSDGITNDVTPTFWGTAEANAVIRLYADLDFDGVVDPEDVLIAMTTAIPIDGTNQFPHGRWTATSNIDLNDPAFFPFDGLRQILVTAEDLSGNVSDENTLDVLQIFLDTRGPQVNDVFISDFPDYDLFDPKPSQAPTPLTYSIDIQFIDQPNRDGANFIYPAVNEIVAETIGNYELIGDHTGRVLIVSAEIVDDDTVPGGPGLTTVRLTFDKPLADDRFSLRVLDSIVDDAGNHLDGESQASSPFNEAVFQNLIFPSGDGQPGGDFHARFTIDTRPEIGDYAAASIFIDINGNFVWDPEGQDNDATNRDLVFTMGVTNAGSHNDEGFNVHDSIFAGNFANRLSGLADGYDKLAAYGFIDGHFRWLLDTDHNGAIDPAQGDFFVIQPSVPGFNLSALPIAGNWDPAHPGDEIGLFDGTRFLLDTNGDNVLDASDDLIFSELRGSPIAGDFDGDGLDDLGTWHVDVFQFDLANDGFGGVDDTIDFGFPGVAEKPVAADMDKDGIDDVGLFVPRRSGTTPEQDAEWYFLLSNDFEERRDNGEENGEGNGVGAAAQAGVMLKRVTGTVNTLDHPFSPAPLGQDLFAQWGDEFAIPVVGNFDPPVAQRSTQLAATTAQMGTVHAPEQLVNLNVSGGKWIAFETMRDGTPSVSLAGGGNAQVRLYDASLQTLTTSATQLASATPVSESLAAGQYFAYLVGGTGTATVTVSNNIAPSDLYDVTRDGQVLPQDVLSIIDDLHRNGFRAIDVAKVTGDLYFDTSLDGQITPQDVLAVLDYINRHAQANGTGGGLLSSSEIAGGLLAQAESSEPMTSSGQGGLSFLLAPNADGGGSSTILTPRSTSVAWRSSDAGSSPQPTSTATVAHSGFTRSVASRGRVIDEAIADEEDWLALI
jgi:subtilisin-like proprotein convertase family protein